MKSKLLTLSLFGLGAALFVVPFATGHLDPAPGAQMPQTPAPVVAVAPVTPVAPITPVNDNGPLIQIALLLDTSGSMDGLIDQARSELWRTVNALGRANRDGAKPRLQLALYEYGNDGLSSAEGYLRMVQGFTSELDQVSEKLFALTTNGGTEMAGLVIQRAVEQLAWDASPDALKVVFIAGNESIEQGPVSSAKAAKLAMERGITVNTIYCGADGSEEASGWRRGALLAGGRFLTIDQGTAVVQIQAPQDQEIARLGVELNETYIPYGGHGAAGSARQIAQDSNSQGYGLANLATRSVSKASALYQNPSWELVDAVKAKTVNLDELDEGGLPANMKKMSKAERSKYVKDMEARRTALQTKIRDLDAERSTFVAAERNKLARTDSLDVAMLEAVQAQAQAKGFRFE